MAHSTNRVAECCEDKMQKITDIKKSGFINTIQFKLMMAMALLCVVAIAASGFGLMSFSRIEDGLLNVTRNGVPTMNVAQSLARQSSELASSGPALNAARNQQEREATFDHMQISLSQLDSLIEKLSNMDVAPEKTESLSKLIGAIGDNLTRQNEAVEHRLSMQKSARDQRRNFSDTLSKLNADLQPAIKEANQLIFGTSQLIGSEIPSLVGKLISKDVSDLSHDSALMGDALLVVSYLREGLKRPLNTSEQEFISQFYDAYETHELRLENRDAKAAALLGQVARLVDNPSIIGDETYLRLATQINKQARDLLTIGQDITEKSGGVIQGNLSENMDILIYEGAGELGNLLKAIAMIEILEKQVAAISQSEDTQEIGDLANILKQAMATARAHAQELESDESITLIETTV
ncbi:MAG: hypothetical protein R3261_13120, partial [Alphaproteobacteria bacterium]|nr:hypothetical protein [Alphaproteobacteria bacterium]